MPTYRNTDNDRYANILLAEKCYYLGLKLVITGLALLTPPALLLNIAFQLASVSTIGLLVGIPFIGLQAIIGLAMIPVALVLAIGLTFAIALVGGIAPWLGSTLIVLGAVLDLTAVAKLIYEYNTDSNQSLLTVPTVIAVPVDESGQYHRLAY
ncbi:MAG: hypothetical protein EBY16_09595 [Gammaproteobacteria bacterium]|nr:hypothetical protein [Gammaproteobacteria bacterium]